MTASNSSDRPRKMKFRSSCDSCSTSKVKCDQGLPTCARCINMGIKCNYSPSRRMGKPPAIGRDSTAKAKTSKKRPLLSPPLSSVSSHERLAFDPQNASLDSLFPDPAEFLPMQWQSSEFSPSPHLGDSSESDIPSLFPHSVDIENNSWSQATTPGLIDFGLVGAPFNLDKEFHEAMTAPSPAHNGFNSQPCTNPLAFSSDRKEASDQFQDDCASLVSSTLIALHSLQVDSGTCNARVSNNNAQPINSIEQVLITNKAAMACMDKTLACPCSHNPHYALTLALMCHKILVRYEAIIKKPHAASALGSCPPKTENFSATPITVGAYRMDAEDERRLKIQLVVNELRKMKGVIERYEEKYCASIEGDKDRRNSIYTALESFLRSDLKEKLKSMVNALQD